MIGVVLFGLLACEEPVELVPATEVLALSDPERIAVGPAIGTTEVEIPLRIVNSYGATVPGELFEVEVTGDSLASYDGQIQPDGLGFGSLVIASEQPQAIETVVVAATDGTRVGGEGTAWLTGTEAVALPLQRGFTVDAWPEHIARGSGGVAWAFENAVWWQRTDVPVPPDPVLTLPDLIDGMTSVDLDRDGYQDLVVWTATRVVLMRGRGVDGYAWSTGFTTPGARLRGVDVADFDGDRLPDLAVAFAEIDGVFQGAQVLLQTGVDSWEALPPLRRELELSDVAVGDFVGDGLSEVVLLTADGPFRYGYVENWTEPDRAWNRVDPDLTWLLDPGGMLMPSRDLDGEGTPELIGVGTASAIDADLHLSFYAIGESATRFDLGFSDFSADIVDLTGDGTDDVALLIPDGSGAQLRTVTTDAEDGNFKNRGLASLPRLGELAVGDLDDDGDRDVAVGGEALWVYDGGFEDGSWGVEDGGSTSFGLSLAGPVMFHDWDSDGRADLLAVREVSSGVVLQHFEVGLDPDTGTTVLNAYDDGQASVDDHDPAVKALGLELVLCDDVQIYVLVSDGETVAHRVRLGNDGSLELKDVGVVTGDHMVCGDLASGGVVALVTEAGDVTETDGGFRTKSTYSLGTAVYDVVVADFDGQGPGLQTCSSPGCSLAVVDFDGDGSDELLEGGDRAVLRLGERDVDLGLSGVAGAADLDGDGLSDLVLTDTANSSAALVLYAGTDLMHPRYVHTRRGLASPFSFADADADGVPEAWYVSTDGTLVHTARSGEVATDTDTTGDSGS